MLTVILSERSESKDLGGWESVRKTPPRFFDSVASLPRSE